MRARSGEGSSTRTDSHNSAAAKATPAQKLSVPFHPHAADIRGTSQMESTPPRFPIRLSSPAETRGFAAPITVAVVKNGDSAPLQAG